jgi:hypothetical protein
MRPLERADDEKIGANILRKLRELPRRLAAPYVDSDRLLF